MRVLLREAGSVVARDTLMREVWGSDPTGSTKTLDMHVSWLRRSSATTRLTRTTSRPSAGWVSASKTLAERR